MELNQSIENPLGAGTQVGQAEAFVYTPNQNVFATIQGALDKNLQLQQDNLKKKEEAKKKQDAEFEKIMMDLQVDPKWDKSLAEMSEHIDNVGDLVYKWRASGKPIGVEFYTTLNKEIARQNQLKSMNEKTFDAYTKYKADALANEKVDQADVELWEKGLDAQKTIEDRFNYINDTPKPGEYFDILKPFSDYFSEEERNGRLTKTNESKQKEGEKAVWTSRNPTERERMLRLAGKNLKLTDENGMPRNATEDEFLDYIHKSMKFKYVKELAPSTASGLTAQQKRTGAAGVRTATSQGFSDYVGLPTDTTPMQVIDNNQQLISIIPSGVQYMGKPGESKIAPLGGWHIEGKIPGNTQTKTFKDKAEADAWASANEGGTIAEPEFDEQTNTLTYKTLETVYVPYDWNKPKFKAQYPNIDVVGLAQQYNTANNKGNPEYYQVPLLGSDDPRNFQ
jgi:hypothetical protein